MVGLGIDLIEISRVRRADARWGGRLARKLMGPEEEARLPLSGEPRVLALARAIVAKEAAAKALGTGWSRGVRWKDVVLEEGESLRFEARAADFARRLGSRGAARTAIERSGDLVLGEVRLLG